MENLLNIEQTALPSSERSSRPIFVDGPFGERKVVRVADCDEAAKCVEAVIDVPHKPGIWASDHRHASHFRLPTTTGNWRDCLQLRNCGYVEDVQVLTAEILATIGKATEHMSNDHIRNAVIGASLITAAQTLDGLPMPTLWRRGGITGMIRHTATKWL
jgi:hypothetical protein